MAQIKTVNNEKQKFPLILDQLQKKIYGERSEKLTVVEINKIFQLTITPEFNLLLYKALEKNSIDANIAILQIIPRAKTRDYLIPIALCLRYGADANMYVNAPKIGIIHILGYVYTLLSSEDKILNTIILMLVIQGAKSSLPMFDNKAGKIRKEGELTPHSLTVIEWLSNQGYQTILTRINSELEKNLDVDSIAILSILLDNPNIMKREYKTNDLFLAIRCFSPISIDKIPLSSKKILIDYESLDTAVTYFNSSAYEKLVKKGQLPSYILINKILIGMKVHKNNGFIVAVKELERMLIVSVSVGIQLDQDQISIISTMGADILESVMKEYETPYWQKICKVSNINGDIPETLRKLAISLNINPNLSQAAICDNIASLSKSDKEAIKESARKRQQTRISSDLGYMNEFLNDNVPTLTCRNKNLLQHNPYDYNDIDIAYYRDDQGVVWCFPSDMFSAILESGVNPYNSTVLPQSFKYQLSYQIDILKRLGINEIYRSPTTFSQAVDNLNNKDIISEKSNLNNFIKLANIHNISTETITSLSKEKLMSALNAISYKLDLIQLSTSHALVTVGRLLDILYKSDPNSVKFFFEALK